MKKILLADQSTRSAQAIMNSLSDIYPVTWISKPEDFGKESDAIDMLVLNHNFTEMKALDFMVKVVKEKRIPVLFLSSPDDPLTASDAMRSGAHSFVVSQGDYHNILPLAVQEGLKSYYENRKLKQTIVELKKRLLIMERQQSVAAASQVSPEAEIAEVDAGLPEEKSGEALKETIIKEIVNSLKSGDISLPAYPEISLRFKELYNSGVSLTELCRLLEQDVAISAKIISVANSPIYRGTNSALTLDVAINRIGLSETRNYVELITNRSLYLSSSEKYGAYLQSLWSHSLGSAFASQAIALHLHHDNPSEYFLMGLFHDIGKLLMTQMIGRLENTVLHGIHLDQGQFEELVEKNHSRFGEFLMKRWRFGERFSRVVRHVDGFDKMPVHTTELATLNLADKIARFLGYGSALLPEEYLLENSPAAHKLKLKVEQLEKIKNSVSKSMTASAGI